MKAEVTCTLEKTIMLDIDDELLTDEYFAEFSKGLWDMKSKPQMIKFIAYQAFDEPSHVVEGIGMMKPLSCAALGDTAKVTYDIQSEEMDVILNSINI